MSAQITQTDRNHNSEDLEPKELKWLISFVAKKTTKDIAAAELGLASRGTLHNIMKGGTGQTKNIKLIKEKYNIEMEEKAKT